MKWKKPRLLSAVRITEESLKSRYWMDGKGVERDRYKGLLDIEDGSGEPCQMPGGYFLFLGEVPNVRGHCAVVGVDGKVHFLYHTDEFRELTDDET